MKHSKKNRFWSVGLVTCLAAISAVFLYAQSDKTEKNNELKPAQKAFDLDGDGILNEAERVKMYETALKNSGIDPTKPRPANPEGVLPDFFGGPPPFGPGGPGGRGGGPGGFGGGRRGPGGAKLALVEKYDQDEDGKLNDAERAEARIEATDDSEGGGGRGPRRRGSPQEPAEEGISISPNDVENYTKEHLYDPTVIRTLFLSFDNGQWESELNDFYKTDVEVPANLTVDGKKYATVGVRFRGNTSTGFVSAGFKKSLNISVDYDEEDQRLYGYKTLNLLNAHGDPSLMREVLFSRIASDYMPALKANYVRVVINGENWGLYVNSQQFDKIFLDEAFDTKGGIRWKKPADPRRGGGLKYAGDSGDDYKGFYQLKTNVDSEEEQEAWEHYVQFAKTLATTPVDQLEEALDPYLDIDQALWFLAMENTFIDADGYWVRASDFNFYQDPNGRFHVISHDNNETFRKPGGGGFNAGRVSGLELSPLFGMGEESKPLLRILENPALQARYLAHVKTIAKDWLNWEKVNPIVESYKELIQKDVQRGTKRESSFDDFLTSLGEQEVGGGVPGLQYFIEDRGKFLLGHPLLNRPTASIQSVKAQSLEEDPNEKDQWKLKTNIVAKVSDPDNALDSVYLYATANPIKPFQRIKMNRNNSGEYEADVSSLTPGKTLHYYVEARGTAEKSGSSYYPETASFQPLQLALHPEVKGKGHLKISEAMAANKTSIKDPQGEFDDWIEIHNSGTKEMNLSTCFLSDNGSKPLKWQFPANIILQPNQRLIVWADEDGKASGGLHANFKLSANGENIVLSKRENSRTEILDYLAFEKMPPDVSITHQGRLTEPTPGY